MRFQPLLTLLCFILWTVFSLSSCRKNIPVEISIESGNTQVTPLNAELANPLVVKAVNHKGEPIEGLEVTFLISSGSGTFVDGDFQYVDTTNAEGLAEARWIFGSENFTQQVQAHIQRYNGSPLTFFASPEFYRDSRDGQTYLLAQMGAQVWMAQNMRLNTPSSLANPNYPNSEYGRLYPWSDLATLCPPGYHVPTVAEWDALIIATGNDDKIGRKVKSLTGWGLGGNGRNQTGFNIYPTGNYVVVDNLNEFRGYQEFAAFWTNDEVPTNPNNAYYRLINEDGVAFALSNYEKVNLSACRCVRD